MIISPFITRAFLHYVRVFSIVNLSVYNVGVQNFTEVVLGEPLRRRLNARGVAKYRDVGHVKGCISETVQDTASGTIND